MISGRHFDDHPLHHGHSYHRELNEEALDNTTSDDDTDLTEKDTNAVEDIEPELSEDIVSEVRDGIEDQRDVEAGPTLEKSRTTRSRRSARDPNLVSWTGPDDAENPKNWSNGR